MLVPELDRPLLAARAKPLFVRCTSRKRGRAPDPLGLVFRTPQAAPAVPALFPCAPPGAMALS